MVPTHPATGCTPTISPTQRNPSTHGVAIARHQSGVPTENPCPFATTRRTCTRVNMQYHEADVAPASCLILLEPSLKRPSPVGLCLSRPETSAMAMHSRRTVHARYYITCPVHMTVVQRLLYCRMTRAWGCNRFSRSKLQGIAYSTVLRHPFRR